MTKIQANTTDNTSARESKKSGFNPIGVNRLGIDLGGTKIEAVLLASNGDIICREREPTPQGDYSATLEAISEVIARCVQGRDVHPNLPIGIGTPGAASPNDGLMMNCNSTCLNGQALRQDLEVTTKRSVRLANDADCFVLSEASDGAAAGNTNVFGVIIGTGVGGGIVINGQLLKGSNALCGEWGHTILPAASFPELVPYQARHCFCGKTDCVETWLAGPGFEKTYQVLSGITLSAQAIVAKAESGDHIAEQHLANYTELLAIAFSQVVNLLDPDVIVCGGGLSNINYLYPHLPRQLEKHVNSAHLNTKILPARHGDSSGVRGAAWLWSEQEAAQACGLSI